MRRHFRIVLIICLVAAAGGLIWFAIRSGSPDDPIYHGRRLSSWLDDASYTAWQTPPPMPLPKKQYSAWYQRVSLFDQIGRQHPFNNKNESPALAEAISFFCTSVLLMTNSDKAKRFTAFTYCGPRPNRQSRPCPSC